MIWAGAMLLWAVLLVIGWAVIHGGNRKPLPCKDFCYECELENL